MKTLSLEKMEKIEGGTSTYCTNLKATLNGQFQGSAELYIFALSLYARYC